MGTALSVVTPTALFTGQQLKLMRQTVAKDCNESEFNLFIAVAQRTNLDPFRKQIYALVFNKDKPEKRNMSIITGIDGFRVIAARSGRYRPDEDEALYEYDAALKTAVNPLGIVKASVRIWIADAMKEGGWKPVSGWAYWDEFAPISDEWAYDEAKGKRQPTGKKTLDTGGNWGKMPRVMIAKCFDDQTEVLTAAGFQRFSEASAPIMQVTPGGLEPVAAAPFRQPYAGDMVVLDSDDLNFCVTPNHDMLTTAGKIEAGTLYQAARSRAAHFIPRMAPGRALDAEITGGAIRLAAAYLADGSDSSASGFRIAVSRPKKIEALGELGLHHSEAMKPDAGRIAHSAGREIVTKSDKVAFSYKFMAAGGMVAQGKTVDMALLTSLSRRQARLFVDTLVEFDGYRQGTSGVRRFYSSRESVMAAFELAAVIGGYAVSNRKSRTSDIGSAPNLYVTISDRDAIPVVRRGDGGTSLELRANTAGEVWCVTVPSGLIVVRRNGFSMICGNCAEAQALRKAFPEDLSGLYEGAEVDRARVADLLPSEVIGEFEAVQRLERVGGPGILFQFFPNSALESIPVGKVADRVEEAVKAFTLHSQMRFFESVNQQPLRDFWAHAPGDALELKKIMDRERARLLAAETAERETDAA